MKFYDAGTWGQRATSAKVNKPTQIFCLAIGARKAGDVVLMTADEEVTTNIDDDTWVWTEAFISTDPAALVTPSDAHLLTGRNGTNVLAAQHHVTFNKSGMCKVPANGTYYVIMTINWMNDFYPQDGTIEGHNYGKCTALVYETGIDI